MNPPPVLPPITILAPITPPTPPIDRPSTAPSPVSSEGPATPPAHSPPRRPSTAGPRPLASPKRAGQPMSAPIGIPAGRRRANTHSLLSSSPTNTPFMVSSLDPATLMTEPPRGVLASSLPARPRASRSVSSGPAPRVTKPSPPKANGTPKPMPAKSTPSSPKLSKPAAVLGADMTDINFLLANNSCLAEALAGGDLTAAGIAVPKPSKPRAASTSKKAGWRSRLFDFEHVLGALDPSRIAEPTPPEPVKAVVFGADTEAGLVVCRALLTAKGYILTALTVDEPDSAAAEELKDAGARVLQVDMDNPASYHTELKGAAAVFLSSNVITLHSILQHQAEPARTEIARRADRCQLLKAAHACARARVGHLVFRVNACGHEIVENSLGKKEVVNNSTPEELRRLGVPHTVLHTSVPFSRLNEWLVPTDKGLLLDLPVPDDTSIPWFAVEQTGDYVLAALRNPKKWVGHDMHAISDKYTPVSMAARLNRMARRPVATNGVTKADFDSLESHERLTLRWDAWNQLVRNQYDFEHETRATAADVAHQWKLGDWVAQNPEMLKKLKH
ncbi:hypothetical protein CcaverHIS002_0403150 [Cutaneotrichosporon cavernicola]|uniref:NmrA-like domain-containing protein n=1 Tax=Cutaneotrichosporon cavernicola TaxID=279322 RepID=A0AA48L3V8_9TREE|nr:uncharacterized protein CcaverHIS019_0403110 [Cutaneotrichosporon cavernicola]BEI83711.1 hypothetical protein CcaverHIS002_0403150 [Cutaneotrichosporon cavernicola]BEI91491.1 hypothetical protein CcaverHIS019_0403110 [Cutaneotrichosporon cavernicola]BEI99266.1 hypothetical protein CcaverHIS631_0403090 [Cutaneotrichosporon cavernicola]